VNFFSFFDYLNREVFTQDASYLPDTRQPLFELFLQDELRNQHLENRKKTVLHSLLHQTVLIHSLTIPNYFYSFLFRSFSVHEIML